MREEVDLSTFLLFDVIKSISYMIRLSLTADCRRQPIEKIRRHDSWLKVAMAVSVQRGKLL